MNEIEQFINTFKEAKDFFCHGHCYWFAAILRERFGGEIFYDELNNHFACKIGGKLYDVCGEICEFVPWNTWATNDIPHRARVIKNCIEMRD